MHAAACIIHRHFALLSETSTRVDYHVDWLEFSSTSQRNWSCCCCLTLVSCLFDDAWLPNWRARIYFWIESSITFIDPTNEHLFAKESLVGRRFFLFTWWFWIVNICFANATSNVQLITFSHWQLYNINHQLLQETIRSIGYHKTTTINTIINAWIYR